MIQKLISGGQTGADRAGLDVAIRHGFPHGGWCPKGRKAEDGPIGGQYQLTAYWQREKAVNDWDGPNYSELIRDKRAAASSKHLSDLIAVIWPKG